MDISRRSKIGHTYHRKKKRGRNGSKPVKINADFDTAMDAFMKSADAKKKPKK
jgi:hypothetical protein